MSWLDVVTQLELDADAYDRIAADPDAPLPPPWSPSAVAGPPPPELLGRLQAALARLEDAKRALVVAKVRKADELHQLHEQAAPPVARYIDTTA